MNYDSEDFTVNGTGKLVIKRKITPLTGGGTGNDSIKSENLLFSDGTNERRSLITRSLS